MKLKGIQLRWPRRCLPHCVVAVIVFLMASLAVGHEPRQVGTSTGLPPSDAIVIFSGENTDHLVKNDGSPCDWPVVGDHLVVPGTQRANRGVWTKYHFRDAQIHVEFRQPVVDSHNGNSGLYFYGVCELQIYAVGKGIADFEQIGAIYKMHAPLANAGRGPGEWQTYDIVHHAPRHRDDGTPISDGTLTVLLNGVLVQDDAKYRTPVSQFAPLTFRTTEYVRAIHESLCETEAGPLYLQDHLPGRVPKPLDSTAR